MKRFINGIEEHRWVDFCQDWIERRDGKNMKRIAIMEHLLVNMDKILSSIVDLIHILFI